ncbi:MAG: flagellar hook capping protein [Lachnospiraceae bacterium]|nr:flagellar hook capping protein [Lachnospiraceae bacterium]
MADNVTSVSGTSNAYEFQNYTVESNDKNTLSMTDFFKLLATQLQNQDTTNPMETSEMMAQLTQMGMMQAMSSMTDAMEASTATTTQTYAGSLLGQEVTVMVTEEVGGVEIPTGVKYGKVEYVSFVNGNPTFKLEGDKKEYVMSYLVGVGKIPDPYADREDGSGEDLGGSDKVEGDTEGSGESGSTTEGTDGVKDPTDVTGGTEGTKDPTDVTEGVEEGAAAAAGVTDQEEKK